MKHTMVDLETWGVAPGSAIRSIGACMFRPVSTKDFNDERIIGETFYVNVDLESQLAVGLKQEESTVAFWNEPKNRAAQETLGTNQKPLAEALQAFSFWWHKQGAEFFWANGAPFDPVLLEACYRAEGSMISPWKFWDIRDTRTLWDMAQVNHKMWPRKGLHHNALDDAIHQARVCAMASGILFPVQETTVG